MDPLACSRPNNETFDIIWGCLWRSGTKTWTPPTTEWSPSWTRVYSWTFVETNYRHHRRQLEASAAWSHQRNDTVVTLVWPSCPAQSTRPHWPSRSVSAPFSAMEHETSDWKRPNVQTLVIMLYVFAFKMTGPAITEVKAFIHLEKKQ